MKVLIIDSDFAHGAGMRTRFLNRHSSWTAHIAIIGTGTPSGNIVVYKNTIEECIDYAISNGYNLIARNYHDGYITRSKYKEAFLAGIPAVVSDGSNERVNTGNELCVSPWFVGGGISTNERSYSNGLEVFDSSTTDETAESWAAASFAARVAKAIDTFGDTNLWDLRQRMRQAASFFPTGWILDGGYGAAADATSGELGICGPVGIVATKAVNNQTITFSWDNYATSKYSKTRIVRSSDGETIYEGTGATTQYKSIATGSETFSFHTISTTGDISSVDDRSRITVTGLEQYRLSAVSGFAFEQNGPSAVLSWNAVQYANEYTIERSADNGATWSAVGTTTEETLSDVIERANYGYLYRIKATADIYADSEWISIYAGRFSGVGMLATTAIL